MLEESKMPRTLVLCFDGTSNQYDSANTNVVNFFSLLMRDSVDEQLCYYQAGIGTYFSPGVVSPFFTWCAKILDNATAWYLNAHVQDGYKFLMKNYRAGDKICLFGFSRGAYTARALAGMLYKVGLLPKDNDEQINFAYKLYTRMDPKGDELSAGFKRTFSRDVAVEFIGVWDTVASVGLITTKSLPFVYSNSCIKTFRHALSLDERRSKFKPNMCQRPPPDTRPAGRDPEQSTLAVPSANQKRSMSPKTKNFFQGHSRQLSEGSESDLTAKSSSEDPDEWPTTNNVLEVWFAGCHSDVGGSATSVDTKHSLSNISLRWMVREVIASQCGILFEDNAIVRDSIHPMTPFATPPKGEPGASEVDCVDAIQPIHDMLSKKPQWWLLEFIPFHYSWQTIDGIWRSAISCNFGNGRIIHDAKPKFHVTVKDRMDHPTVGYKPKAVWKAGSEVYVQ